MVPRLRPFPSKRALRPTLYPLFDPTIQFYRVVYRRSYNGHVSLAIITSIPVNCIFYIVLLPPKNNLQNMSTPVAESRKSLVKMSTIPELIICNTRIFSTWVRQNQRSEILITVRLHEARAPTPPPTTTNPPVVVRLRK